MRFAVSGDSSNLTEPDRTKVAGIGSGGPTRNRRGPCLIKFAGSRNPLAPVVTFFPGKQSLNGFNVSATGYLTKRILAGVAQTHARLEVPSLNSSDTASSTDFALAIGGGVDVRVNDRIALRVFQADYNPIFLSDSNELGFGNTRADNVRFSFGVVFK